MPKLRSSSSSSSVISLRGVRQNNLKNLDLDLPSGRLIVVTGLSGSGKSSLAFDTLYAEGQRRYVETFSPYARQFFDRMDKPRVDSIRGIPPAIAIEQRNSVKSTRSTVGTMTEICDYMKVLWAHEAILYCRSCGRVVRKDNAEGIWKRLMEVGAGGKEVLVTFGLPLSEKLSWEESSGLIRKQGYQRILVTEPAGTLAVARLDEVHGEWAEKRPDEVTVVQDRVRVAEANRARLAEACEQALHFGRGKLAVYVAGSWERHRFSNRLHCSECDLEYAPAAPALFSFNHPLGACPACRGFGRIISIDYDKVIPDRTLTLAGGAVKPWQSGVSAESQADLLRFCALRGVPADVPFEELPKAAREWVVEGDAGYGKGPEHEWPNAWYGVKGFFRWLESKAYKMHVRVLLSRYRSYQTCGDCGGTRFRPEALLYRMSWRNGERVDLAGFYRMPISEAVRFLEEQNAGSAKAAKNDPLTLVRNEVLSRLGYLLESGLGYLTLDRTTRTLSGGETERVNLTACLGSRLVNTLFVLDEPSVGLHPRDTDRLVGILEKLRDSGNTVVVVEHEASVMRAADQIVDLGPGHGETGGELVFQGRYAEILKHPRSLTGQYLSGRKKIETPERREIGKETKKLRLTNATLHNLKEFAVEIPLNRFVCVTGVSGSGKTTLVRELLLPALQAALRRKAAASGSADGEEMTGDDEDDGEVEADGAGQGLGAGAKLAGFEQLDRVIMADQTAIGRTPRSNPAVYIGAFDAIRELFARSEAARQLGLGAGLFSFNSARGQCERCRGVGFEKIEMQFLSDIFVRCPDCDGRRYRPFVLEIKIKPPGEGGEGWSIADILESSVERAVEFLGKFEESRHARIALGKIRLLADVGLGYLRLGQPVNTLSGGESQRLKLATHLAEFGEDRLRGGKGGGTLFVFDEPTTGLHFEDARILLGVFQRLVDAGHSLLVVEHNVDVVKSADWVIDLGPEAGAGGGRLAAEGTPEAVAGRLENHTGRALRQAGIRGSKG